MSGTATGKRVPARDRLLAAADNLFYREGVAAVGIDRVLAEAGCAKGSLYYNFGGKDELAAAYLRARHGRWDERVQAGIAAASTPKERILSIFLTMRALFEEPDYNGCAFMNASVEASAGSAEAAAVTEFRAWLHALFLRETTVLGTADPQRLARQLVILYDGASATASADHRPVVADEAREMAATMLDLADRH